MNEMKFVMVLFTRLFKTMENKQNHEVAQHRYRVSVNPYFLCSFCLIKIKKERRMFYERNYLSRWKWYTIISFNKIYFKTTTSNLRQADDLLSDFSTNACWYQRYSNYLNT